MIYQGKTGFNWFTGVIEDRNDPMFLNRVRVRIHGSHSHDKQMIATPDLPWSEVMMPTTSPSISGLGTTTHGLLEGSTVMGFYRDHLEMQDPVVIGSFIGTPQEFYRVDEEVDNEGTRKFTQIPRTTEDGFNDPRLDSESSYEGTPDGPSPKHINRTYGLTLALDKSPSRKGIEPEVYPKTEYIGTSDVNNLAKGINSLPLKDDINGAYPKLEIFDGEPKRRPIFDPVYPFNHVHETESGHIIELDDTPEKERIHLMHRSGTRIEISKDGDYNNVVRKDKYTVVLGDDTVTISGNVNVNVTGDANITVGGNLKADITGTSDVTSEGKLTITGNDTTEIISDTTITGTLHISGAQTNDSTITATDSITGKDVVLDTHTHTIKSGSSAGKTNKPD